MGHIELRLEPAACIIWAAALLLVPLNWMGAAFLAAAVHELGHFSAVLLCGGRVFSLTLGLGGAVMETTPLSDGRALACILAGPAAALLLVMFSRYLPRTAVCAFIQTAFNLLPVLPLDGGQALKYILNRIFRIRNGEKILGLLRMAVILILTVVLLFGGFSLEGLIILGVLFFQMGKRPCKPGKLRVQ